MPPATLGLCVSRAFWAALNELRPPDSLGLEADLEELKELLLDEIPDELGSVREETGVRVSI